jgi:1-acyl-sn-glycerol-3-phosphate acyltransferase
MLYSLLALSSRHALRWCYRDVHVVGELPATGPLLLAVNHPNDLADICAVLAHVPRRVNFVANVSATEQRIVAWAYGQMGVVPVHRVRDARKAKARGEDSAQANALAFTRVRDVLRSGGCVCVFPEGGVNAGSHLGALRNGLARMALEARDDGDIRNVRIVPVGLTYESRYERRTRVVIAFGDPIVMDAWQAPESRAAAPQLTATIASRLRAITRNAPDEDAVEAMRAVTSVVAASAQPGEHPMCSATHVWHEITAEVYGPGIAAPVQEHARVKASLELFREIERGLPDVSAERALIAWRARQVRGAPSARAARLVRAPLALLGGAMHVPVWMFIHARARRAATKVGEVIPHLIVPGLYVMVAWYLAVAGAVAVVAWWRGLGELLSAATGIAVLVFAPRLGDAAMRSLDWWHDGRLAARLRSRLPNLSERLMKAVQAAATTAAGGDDRVNPSAVAPAHNVAQPI